MHYLNNYYNKTLKYELINKFHYFKLNKLPKIKKIILNFNCKTSEIKIISTSLLALELLTYQKGLVTKANKTNIFVKIRKGNPIGCKVRLKKKLLFFFLAKNCLEIFPKLKNFNGFNFKQNIKKNKNSFSYQIKNLFNSSNLKDHFYLFNNTPNFNIILVSNNNKMEELLFILSALQIPFKN